MRIDKDQFYDVGVGSPWKTIDSKCPISPLDGEEIILVYFEEDYLLQKFVTVLKSRISASMNQKEIFNLFSKEVSSRMGRSKVKQEEIDDHVSSIRSQYRENWFSEKG